MAAPGHHQHVRRDREAGNNILVASWYGREEANNYYQGAKVTFINANSDVLRYRHVLLVEPVRRFDEEKAWYDFQPVRVHAGGIAWYKHRLYVADSERGALRVFNTDEMFRATGYSKEHCGLHGGAYHAFGNGYVLPQGRIYDLTGSKKLRFSQVALDRTTPTDSLVVSEWIDGAKSTRIARWNLNEDSRYGYLGQLTSRPTVRIDDGGNIQGAVSVRKTFYLSVSNGKKNRGFLKTARPREGVAEARTVGRVPAGPEDVSYQAVSGTPGRIWSLNEYENNRYVYAIRL
ncbi:hypothetical protein [Streptomyces sp. NPDC001820]|uniref:hypothetical protein n=1 Tax=Streptomyces sp. NPDC001820 TaxID=3364613 RepID=UPI003696887E